MANNLANDDPTTSGAEAKLAEAVAEGTPGEAATLTLDAVNTTDWPAVPFRVTIDGDKESVERGFLVESVDLDEGTVTGERGTPATAHAANARVDHLFDVQVLLETIDDRVVAYLIENPPAPGEDGEDGQDGADGAPGADGRTVLNGAGAPNNVVGQNGDFYIDTTAVAIYGPKGGGTWAGAGPVSLVGIDGEDGNLLLAGAGAPDPELGNVGDWYIDTTDWVLVGPKDGGAGWEVSQVELIGPQGDPGDPGPETLFAQATEPEPGSDIGPVVWFDTSDEPDEIRIMLGAWTEV